MHVYSSDADTRRVIAFILAALSIAAIFGLQALLSRYQIPASVSVLSSFGLYGLFHYLFDNYVWKWGILNGACGPNLTGTWRGVLKSSHSSLSREHRIELHVHQTWSRIKIVLDGEKANSESQMAVLTTSMPSRHELIWEYLARTKDVTTGSFMHLGVTHLRIVSTPTFSATGSYYTEQNRNTYGTIELSRNDS